jgi:hypothetical protein
MEVEQELANGPSNNSVLKLEKLLTPMMSVLKMEHF